MTCLNIIIHINAPWRLFGGVNQTLINIRLRFCEEEFVCKKFICITASSVSLQAPRPCPACPILIQNCLLSLFCCVMHCVWIFYWFFLFNLINNHGEGHVPAVTRPRQGHPNCGERDINIVKIHFDNVSSPGTHYPVMIGWCRDNIQLNIATPSFFCWLLIN